MNETTVLNCWLRKVHINIAYCIFFFVCNISGGEATETAIVVVQIYFVFVPRQCSRSICAQSKKTEGDIVHTLHRNRQHILRKGDNFNRVCVKREGGRSSQSNLNSYFSSYRISWRRVDGSFMGVTGAREGWERGGPKPKFAMLGYGANRVSMAKLCWEGDWW